MQYTQATPIFGLAVQGFLPGTLVRSPSLKCRFIHPYFTVSIISLATTEGYPYVRNAGWTTSKSGHPCLCWNNSWTVMADTTAPNLAAGFNKHPALCSGLNQRWCTENVHYYEALKFFITMKHWKCSLLSLKGDHQLQQTALSLKSNCPTCPWSQTALPVLEVKLPYLSLKSNCSTCPWSQTALPVLEVKLLMQTALPAPKLNCSCNLPHLSLKSNLSTSKWKLASMSVSITSGACGRKNT